MLNLMAMGMFPIAIEAIDIGRVKGGTENKCLLRRLTLSALKHYRGQNPESRPYKKHSFPYFLIIHCPS
ncbi:MAG: hypothetical protein ABF649_13745 [Bacillus sp. (in: firmicutes)]